MDIKFAPFGHLAEKSLKKTAGQTFYVLSIYCLFLEWSKLNINNYILKVFDNTLGKTNISLEI